MKKFPSKAVEVTGRLRVPGELLVLGREGRDNIRERGIPGLQRLDQLAQLLLRGLHGAERGLDGRDLAVERDER